MILRCLPVFAKGSQGLLPGSGMMTWGGKVFSPRYKGGTPPWTSSNLLWHPPLFLRGRMPLGGSWKQTCFSHGSRASNLIPFGSQTAPKMEAIWIPKVVDFRSHENLDLGDPSHSLEGSRESKVDACCTLFQLLSRASVERSPGHILADLGSMWEPKMVPKCA